MDIGVSPGELAERLTMAGFEVTELREEGSDFLLDLDITANRPDCLGLVGIAREFAAISGTEVKSPGAVVKEEGEGIDKLVRVTVEDGGLCPRYTARVITGVKVCPSPDWLRVRLAFAGIKSINNIVDVTNYCMMELAQPLHAFDYETLKGGAVIVRRAKKGEKIVLLDGKEPALTDEMLVIADSEVPLALAGIMGGHSSQVKEGTVNILLESACFDPANIRRTSRTLAVETESSYRFQRGVDIEGVVLALDRAAWLILSLAGGKAAKGAADCRFRKCAPARRIPVRTGRVNKILGTNLTTEAIAERLRGLQFKTKKDAGGLTVTVPSCRRDITREIDLIEEVARLYGYDNIQVSAPSGRIPVSGKDKLSTLCREIRHILTGCGLTEVITHGLLSKSSGGNLSSCVEVTNPIIEEQSVLRPTLLPGLLRVVSTNIAKGVKGLGIFELGRVFAPGDRVSAPHERTKAAGVLTGVLRQKSWNYKEIHASFWRLKGVVEALFRMFGITGYEISPRENSYFSADTSAEIILGGEPAGILGEVSEEQTQHRIGSVYLFELDVERLLEVAGKKEVLPPPRYPAVTRDIAVVLPEGVGAGEVASLIGKAGGKLVEDVRLFDLYQGEQVPEGCKSLAYSISYRSQERTLTDAEVNEVHSGIVCRLASEFGAGIRK